MAVEHHSLDLGVGEQRRQPGQPHGIVGAQEFPHSALARTPLPAALDPTVSGLMLADCVSSVKSMGSSAMAVAARVKPDHPALPPPPHRLARPASSLTEPRHAPLPPRLHMPGRLPPPVARPLIPPPA